MCDGQISLRKLKPLNFGGEKCKQFQILKPTRRNLTERSRNGAQKLEAKAQQAGADAQAKFRDHMDTIRKKESAARAKLTEFGNAAQNAGDEIKLGLDKAVNDFSPAVDKARAQFN